MAKPKIALISLLAISAVAGCGGTPSSSSEEPASQEMDVPTNPGGAVQQAPAMGSTQGGDASPAFQPQGEAPPNEGVAVLDPVTGDDILLGASEPASVAAGPAGSVAAGTPVAPTPGGVPLPTDQSAGEDLSAGAASGGASAGPEAEMAPVEVPAEVEPALTNPFVEVVHDPLSTFAVDVDTASYDIFRRDVNAGTLPPAAGVRLEDFVNFFDYEYPAPEAGAEEPFSIELAAAPNLIDNGTTLLRVGIQGELAPAFEKRAANLVFLVDVSGSMLSEEKLPLVKRVLTYTLEVLEPEDTVSIVTYASGTEVRLEPTKVNQADVIRGVIDSLDAGGSTNGAGGIQLAYEQAEAGFVQGGINHVILATDGDFNVGVSDTAGLVALIEEKRLTGVTLTALGFGASNNDQMMELVSNAGNGVYGVIADEAQAETYVSDRLLHNLTFIAKDVKIQVEFNPDQVLAYRLLGYENRAIADQDFRNDVVDAGEIGAGHRVTALYQLVLTGGEVPVPEGAPEATSGEAYSGAVEVAVEDLVLVKVRYKDVDATVDDAAYEVARTLAPSAIAQSHLDLDQDFQWAVAMATFAEVLAQNPYANAFDLDQIQNIVDEQAERDADRAEFATLFQTARQMIDPR